MSDIDLSRVFTIDFETTDKDPKIAKPVEVAVYNTQFMLDALINPGVPIPAETSAIHHITDSDVEGCADWPFYREQIANVLVGREPLPILVAHNAEYERTILGEFVPVIWVCTYKCALRVWPDAPAHRNEVLRYHLNLGDDLGRNRHQNPHSAMHDAKVTYKIFLELLKHRTLDELVEWTEQPGLLPKIPMGKFYGKPWSAADNGYLTWCINQTDMREDVKYCAKLELDRRRNNATSGPR
jgi:exodeoxyribonuclease X